MWPLLLCVYLSAPGLRAAFQEFPDFWHLETFNTALDPWPDHAHWRPARLSAAEPVRALDVREWNAREPLRFRAASTEETDRFEAVVQPSIALSERRGGRLPRVGVPPSSGPTPSPAPSPAPAADDARLLADIREMVNKFVVSAAAERGQELTDAVSEDTNPTITVYFRGEYSVILLEAERREWRFVCRPPSPWPPHTPRAPHTPPAGAVLPSRDQTQFYYTLRRLLKVFLRFDL